MAKGSNDGAIAGVIAMAVMAVCCGAPLLIGALALGAPAALAVRGMPWVLVGATAVVGLALVGLIVWRRRAATCDVGDRQEDPWRRKAS